MEVSIEKKTQVHLLFSLSRKMFEKKKNPPTQEIQYDDITSNNIVNIYTPQFEFSLKVKNFHFLLLSQSQIASPPSQPPPVALSEGHQGIPKPAKKYVSSEFYVCLRACPTARDMSKTPLQGLSGRYPHQMPKPPQLVLFYAKENWWCYKPLPDDWASHPPEGEPSHPSDDTHFICLNLKCHSFGPYPPNFAS